MRVSKTQIRRIINEELCRHNRLRQPVLQEGLMDMLSGLGGGVLESIKEAIARKVLSLLGVDVKSTVGTVLINFFGNLTVQDLSEMLMGDNQCVTATGELAGAITESMVESLPASLGLSPDGVFSRAVQEALSKTMTQDLNSKIAEALCQIDYRPIIEEIPGASTVLSLMGK